MRKQSKMPNSIRPVVILILAAIFLAGCGGQETATVDPDTAATLTIEARLPTLQAQIAGIEIQATATLDPASLTASAQAMPADATGLDATAQANMTLAANQTPVTVVTGSGEASGSPPVPTGSGSLGGTSGGSGSADQMNFDGGDENDTTQVKPVTSGATVTGELLKAFDAHNWTFNAQAGQTLTAVVEAGDAQVDPVISLIDSNGVELLWVDSRAGGEGETLTFTFTTGGNYIVRIKGWHVGKYSLRITLG